jgi:hypothetical protein
MIVSAFIHMAVQILAPKGLAYLNAFGEDRKNDFIRFVKQQAPLAWAAEPLDAILDVMLPVVVDAIKGKLKESDHINLYKLSSEVLHLSFQPALDAVRTVAGQPPSRPVC